MNIHEFGKTNEKKIVMIHGICMSWDMFQPSIDLLKEHYHVYAVAVPGHDRETNEEFTSVEEIAAELENQLILRGARDLDILYGLSMGGGFVIRMLADNRLKVKTAVIDAGITPYELPYIVTRGILLKDFLMAEWGKHSRKALALAFPPDEYSEEGIDWMHQVMQHMTAKTIWRGFDSTDNYAMPETFPAMDTRIEYWYGEREKQARKLDIQYVSKHIPNVHFREISGMDHGQYALMKPEAFVNDLESLDTDPRENTAYDYISRESAVESEPSLSSVSQYTAGTAAAAAAYILTDKHSEKLPRAIRVPLKIALGAAALTCGAKAVFEAVQVRGQKSLPTPESQNSSNEVKL